MSNELIPQFLTEIGISFEIYPGDDFENEHCKWKMPSIDNREVEMHADYMPGGLMCQFKGILIRVFNPKNRSRVLELANDFNSVSRFSNIVVGHNQRVGPGFGFVVCSKFLFAMEETPSSIYVAETIQNVHRGIGDFYSLMLEHIDLIPLEKYEEE